MGKWIKRLAMVLTAAVLAGAVYGGLRQAGAYAPENPMDEPAEQYSLIRASEDLEAGSGAGDFYFDISSEFEQEAQDEENPEPEQTEPDPGARQTETGETEGQMLSGGTVLTGGEETGEQEKTQNVIQTAEPPEQENPTESPQRDYDGYFTTSIREGEVLSSRSYSFTIQQKDHGLTVEDTQVAVNGTGVEPFQGQVYLEEGENTITITVTYTDEEEGRTFQVSRSYHVEVVLGEIALNVRGLSDGAEVSSSSFNFDASASYEGEEIPLLVTLNGNTVQRKYSGYQCRLEEGENEIRLKAEAEDGTVKEAVYHIVYIRPESSYEIVTDLADQEVNAAEFAFHVAVTRQGVPTQNFSVRLNGAEIFGTDGAYACSLLEGDNLIEILAGSLEERVTEQYVVNYVVVVPGDGDADLSGQQPRINYSGIGDGMEIRDTVWNIELASRDYKGERIQADGISVTCNGETAVLIWDDSVKTSYRLHLTSGINEIIFTVTDSYGNIASETIHVTCTAAEDGAVIGTVTISLEATTIGLGSLIPPTQVEIRQGESLAYVLDRFLKAHGFDYTCTGTLESGFYLASVIKEGIISSPSVPEDLARVLEENNIPYSLTDYGSPDELGEFDFGEKSGWMYSIDGNYPNYGFSDAYLTDGNEVRIRYTLALGRDIGGGGAAGDENSNLGEW
ncbi:MAG TPA: DUF4430 domain-containing protein [Firmicutes bacterium]|nr:DUF4430 domain-containing protein [Bacillota bacterium]